MKHKVLIVDDHPLLRQGLAALLETLGTMEVCAQAASRFEAIKAMEACNPALAIVDMSLGRSPQDGFDLIKDMKRLEPAIKILVFTMHDECIYAERAIAAGASGYLMKKEPSAKILEALNWMLKGNIYASPKVSQQILLQSGSRREESGESVSRINCLTEREFEILQALSNGQAPHIVAKKLGISVKTLDVHKSNLKKKLLLRSAAALNEFSINYFRPQAL